jgi:diguanylate cyclase
MARARLLDALAELAVTDELTGLTNRREWHRHLELAMARASRSHRPLGVLLMDVDGLKRVNDDLGHAAGDDLLKRVAARWAATLRRADVLGRLGGDEFAVVLEDTDEEAARLLIARLEAALDAGQTASIGIAMWDGAEDGTALLARADAAMYETKRARNGRRAA